MTSRWIRLLAATAVTGLSLAAHTAIGPTAGAQDERGRGAVVVDLDGEVLTAGGSRTEFTLRLPEGAACQGDSEDGQYRVQSFLVPADVDPGTLVYKGLRPQVEGGWALYELDTTTYVNRATAKADAPGGPGEIINVPALSFAVFEPGMIPVGRAHLGIACSLFAETTRSWSTEVEVIADPADPAGIAWQVVDPPASTDDGGRGRAAPWAVGLVAAGAGALVLRRRSTGMQKLP